MIHNRIENKDKFEKEYFSKYSTWKYADSRQKISMYQRFFVKGIRRQVVRRRMKGCKHRVYKYWLLIRDHYYKTFDMREWNRLPGSESEKVYTEAESILKAEAEAMDTPVKKSEPLARGIA